MKNKRLQQLYGVDTKKKTSKVWKLVNKQMTAENIVNF